MLAVSILGTAFNRRGVVFGAAHFIFPLVDFFVSVTEAGRLARRLLRYLRLMRLAILNVHVVCFGCIAIVIVASFRCNAKGNRKDLRTIKNTVNRDR